MYTLLQYSLMDNNKTTSNPSPSPLIDLCTHISKLSKKNIQALLTYNYIPICKGCQISLNPRNMKIGINKITINLCLHCGEVFCTNEQCVQNHEKDSHLFWGILELCDEPPSLLKLQKQTQQKANGLLINCKICGSIQNQLAITLPNQKSEDIAKKQQILNKLKRFTQFLHQNLDKQLSQLIISNFNEFLQLYCQHQPNIFGLKNLGNTCFLNTVLQVLYYTEPFNEIYLNFTNKSNATWNQLISKQKIKRRQIEYYYDSCIQKSESQSWHVVGDKKSKAKQRLVRKNIENFVPSGFVKDSNFNTIFNKFITNLKKLLQETANSKSKEKLIYEPIQILAKLGQFDRKYELKQQQDAQQLLILIIDILSQGEFISMIGNSQDKKERYRKVENLLGRQKFTPVQQIFGSYLASHIVCLGCNKENWTIDFTYHFPVSLEQHKQEQKSIEGDNNTAIQGISHYKQLYYPAKNKQKCNLLQSLFHAQRLTHKQNYYSCEKCQSLSAIKQFYILDPPQILIISFKRFQHNKKYKISKHVKFEQFIQISSYVLREKDENNQINSNQTLNYELYGMIVHKGETISSGHYICFIKVKQPQQKQDKHVWYELSDEKCHKVVSKQVYRQQAYILFYRKTTQKQ